MILTRTLKLFSKTKIFEKLYHKKIIEHFENPKNIGSFPKQDSNVYVGLVGAPACGDVMKIEIKIENDKVVDCKHKVFGCGSAVAASSFSSEFIKGKSIEQVESISNKDIAKYLHLPPVKLHCSMLAEDAIKNAILKYKIVKKKRTKIQNKISIIILIEI